jgi:ArsR family transcriptional regulator
MSTTTTADPRRLARAFQALSDETRLQIVELLSTGEHCVCDLQEALGAYQSRLSFHLKRLKDAGLVRDRKEGRWVYYALDGEALEALAAHLQTVRPPEDALSGAHCCG